MPCLKGVNRQILNKNKEGNVNRKPKVPNSENKKVCEKDGVF